MTYAWTKEEAQIIKAAWANEVGNMALQLVVNRLCEIHGDPHDDNALRMARNNGRRTVGIDLMRAINTPLDKLIKEDTHEPRTSRVSTASQRAANVSAAGRIATSSRSTS